MGTLSISDVLTHNLDRRLADKVKTMGGHPYWYYTDYQSDVPTTLRALRWQEFSAGRYNPAVPFILFPITDDTTAPGPQHSSIEEALEDSDASGTRSILDISTVSPVSYEEALEASGQGGVNLYCTTFPVTADELNRLFNTDKPTHQMIESVIVLAQEIEDVVEEFWDSIARGMGRHILVYEDDEPAEVFFIGYSFD